MSFRDKQAMWGMMPADCTYTAAKLFQENNLHTVLVSGYGYGRNAKVFTDMGMKVTGIEISQTAIDIAKKEHGVSHDVYHGPVSDMPFDDVVYDGIYCYALIHLLTPAERANLLKACDHQLRVGGYMVFVAVSTNTPAFGKGKKLEQNTYTTPHGVTVYYYDSFAVSEEFGLYGIGEMYEITEPRYPAPGQSVQKFWYVVCKKSPPMK